MVPPSSVMSHCLHCRFLGMPPLAIQTLSQLLLPMEPTVSFHCYKLDHADHAAALLLVLRSLRSCIARNRIVVCVNDPAELHLLDTPFPSETVASLPVIRLNAGPKQ